MATPLPNFGGAGGGNPFGGATSPAGGGSLSGPFKPEPRDMTARTGIRGIMRTMRRDSRRTGRR